MDTQKPLLVVLDLDETLIHSDDDHTMIDRAGPPHARIDKYVTYKRPGVEEFVSTLLADDRYRLAVWTSAEQGYAEEVLGLLDLDPIDLEFFFSRDRCVRAIPTAYEFGGSGQYDLIKDLAKVTRTTDWGLDRIIAIDDNRDFYQRQYSNLLLVDPYDGEDEDQPHLFPALLDTLSRLHSLESVRGIEKRGWYQRYCASLEAQESEFGAT